MLQDLVEKKRQLQERGYRCMLALIHQKKHTCYQRWRDWARLQADTRTKIEHWSVRLLQLLESVHVTCCIHASRMPGMVLCPIYCTAGLCSVDKKETAIPCGSELPCPIFFSQDGLLRQSVLTALWSLCSVSRIRYGDMARVFTTWRESVQDKHVMRQKVQLAVVAFGHRCEQRAWRSWREMVEKCRVKGERIFRAVLFWDKGTSSKNVSL